MGRMTELAAAKADSKKVSRTLIRLKHSLAADAELRVVLPDLEDEIDEAYENRKAFSLDIPGLLGQGKDDSEVSS